MKTSVMQRMREERGFTMAEAAVVLAITAALSLFMGTELQAMADRVYLDAAVADVMGDLRYARSLALQERQTVEVAIDAEKPSLALFLAGDATRPIAPARNLMNRGVKVIRSTGGNRLAFYPRGTSATPTTLTLEDRHGAQRVMTVSLTGLVRAR